jgi:eukaryotic-like serine/threonine-protein kinase
MMTFTNSPNNSEFENNFAANLIANRYQLKTMIGKGGMGRVYLAEDKLLGGVNVALKFLTQSVGDPKILRNFAQEARICAILGHKSLHIVKVIDYGIYEDEDPYYVMEYLQGESLRNLLDSRPLSLMEFFTIIHQFCLGLECAHNGIELDDKLYSVIHRDIKPANVFISPEPTLGWLVKILDFGIAKFFSEHSSMTQTNSYIGTLAYSSPEQIDGETKLDGRADIYSLGVMMYEMLANKLPWDINNSSFGAWYKAHHIQEPTNLSIAADLSLPKQLIELVMSCLEKEAKNRPQNVREILKILEELKRQYKLNISGEPVQQIPKKAQEKPQEQLPEKTQKFSEKPPEKTQKFSEKLPERAEDITKKIDIEVTKTQEKPPQITNINQTQTQTIKAENTVFHTYTSHLNHKVEIACWNAIWPKNKPISAIVFPNFIPSENDKIPSIWSMLAKEDIQKYISSSCSNQFLFVPAPHPMILWLTVLYSQQHGFKWLPCYLDMKTPAGLKLAWGLRQYEYYPIIFFSLEKPNNCILVRSSKVHTYQRELFKTWIEYSQAAISTGDANVSKNMLRIEYEKVKPIIAEKIIDGIKNRDN